MDGQFFGRRAHPIRWVLLVGDRLVVAACLFGALLAYLLGLVYFDVVLLRRTQVLYHLLSGLLAGNITLITLVISVNQIVVSRQLGSPGELRERIDNVTEYRNQVLETADMDVAPATPSAFLEQLLRTTRAEVVRLEDLVGGADLGADVAEFVTVVTDHIDRTRSLIDGSRLGAFDTLSAALTTNYADGIYRARVIQSTHATALTDEADAAIEDIVVRLQQIDVARQYFKTLYTQAELAYLSRALLYVGVVSELCLATLLLVLPSERLLTLPLQGRTLLVVTVVAVGFAPLAVLAAFVLRIAVVTQRTSAITPFTTPEQEH